MLWNFIAALDAEGIMDCTYHTDESVNAASFEYCVGGLLRSVLSTVDRSSATSGAFFSA